ncbi:MAG: thermonuclease family protein [Deltaproteobacteria bacterium]|nr:thermonuclease family protein [Deltaproteobacteria bacterium]
MTHRDPRTAEVKAPAPRHLPWNAIFWLITAAFLGGAVFFAVGTYFKQQNLVSNDVAQINDGDKVKVVAVVNGDELIVTKGTAQARVRMLGIRAFDPVVNEREVTAFGHASVSFLTQWTLNKTVTVVFDTPIMDVHGRYLAFVERANMDLNAKMLEEGIVMVYTEFETAREALFLAAERLARRSSRGIWGSKKAASRVVALRQDWAHHRQERTGGLPPDYLLSEKPEDP